MQQVDKVSQANDLLFLIAREEHQQAILDLKNDPVSIYYSGLREPVSFEAHDRFYKSYLSQDFLNPVALSTVIWIVYAQDELNIKILIGSIRIQKTSEGFWIISVVLEQKSRGKRLSKILIAYVINWMKQNFQSKCSRCEVSIRNDNLASIVLFKSFKFKPIYKTGLKISTSNYVASELDDINYYVLEF